MTLIIFIALILFQVVPEPRGGQVTLLGWQENNNNVAPVICVELRRIAVRYNRHTSRQHLFVV